MFKVRNRRWMSCALATAAGSLLPLMFTAAPASAATLPSGAVTRAQKVLSAYGIPVGPVDGQYGAKTAQGLCAFRVIAGVPASRAPMDSTLYNKILAYQAKYTRLSAIAAGQVGGYNTYLDVNKKCQVMLYVKDGRYQRVLQVTTGAAGHTTPNGSYSLKKTYVGWSCSTLHPESCSDHSDGRFATISRYGNMYNKRQFLGNYLVHGSTDIRTYPASHGCVRVRVADADWMYDHVDAGIHLRVTNSY